MLRDGGGEEYAPQPDVDAIPGLVEDVRASGLDVDLLVEGEPQPLPAGPQLAAYRIVQESLTNVLKHAGPASRAWVRLQWRPDALELSVLDDGRGASAAMVASDGSGQGLRGMRERAVLHGGRLDAGPRRRRRLRRARRAPLRSEAMSEPIRVVLADDQQMVRAGFRMVIDSQPDLTVVGEAGDGAAAVDLLRRTAADVVLMDVRMPGTDGIEATRQVTALPEPPRVVVLTTFDLDEYVVAAIGAGASGFLLKDAPPEEMLAAIRTVHAGDSVIAASSTRRLLQHVAPMLRGAVDDAGWTGASSPT